MEFLCFCLVKVNNSVEDTTQTQRIEVSLGRVGHFYHFCEHTSANLDKRKENQQYSETKATFIKELNEIFDKNRLLKQSEHTRDPQEQILQLEFIAISWSIYCEIVFFFFYIS